MLWFWTVPTIAVLIGIIIVQELSRRRFQSERSGLLQSEQQLQLIWDHLPDSILEILQDGTIIKSNRPSEYFDGELLVGHKIGECLAPEQQSVFLNSLSRAIETLTPQSYQLELIGGQGKRVTLSNQLVPIVRATKLASLLVISRDITELTNAQNVLKQQTKFAEDASTAKSRFLASMSHEIRTPMNGLLGMVSLLEGTEMTSEQQGYLRTISHSSEHLLAIVNDVLDLSKIEANKLTLNVVPFDLNDMALRVIEIVSPKAREKSLAIQLFFEDGVPSHVVGDPTRIRQVLMNLLTNAIKFTDEGHVLLRVVLVRQVENDATLRFSVEDSGIGISADKAVLLFEEYSFAHGAISANQGGTGLGLNICQRLANLMGGKIGVVSSPGIGSCFWMDITLPVAAIEVENSLTTTLLTTKNSYDIWVADALAINRALVVSVVRKMGFRVRQFENIESLIAELSRHQPHVLVISSALYRKANFDSVRRAVREHGGRIAMTADNGFFEGSDRLSKQGMDASWEWPIGQEEVKRILLRLLDKTRPVSDIITRFNHEESENKLALEGINILLAEDNPVNQKVVTQILRHLGCEVAVVAHGGEVLRYLEHTRPDIILMDCHMPVMDGVEATAAIRANPDIRDIPIIALSADAMEEQRQLCEDVGMDGYLTKPVRLHDMKQALQAFSQPLTKHFRKG
ncbi:response regulator [Thalassolituus oleivorans]|uniref:response regulator n=1 Tax=Thalassolituus oleivorans TaxID=187493 RepID=UPI00240A23C5|nr:response regulator [Thalassolituus oleivorans]MDF1639915.1 response regulator [Thalassolituus oleivorans]